MAKSTEEGMQTLDQSLIAAYKEGLISHEDAIRYADSANDVRLALKMFEKGKVAFDDGIGLTFDEDDKRGQFLGR
jgi:twitching motility protein PilU